MRFRRWLLIAVVASCVIHAIFAVSLVSASVYSRPDGFIELLFIPHNVLALLYGDMPKVNRSELVTTQGIVRNLLVTLPASFIYGGLVAAIYFLMLRSERANGV